MQRGRERIEKSPGRMKVGRRRPSARAQTEARNDPSRRTTQTCRSHMLCMCWVPQVGGWYLLFAPPSSPQKFCRTHVNELSSQIKHEMGAGCPLGHNLRFSYLSNTVYVYAHAYTSTHAGRGRQKSLTKNKGIIIPYREKWSLHFPARFRSLI